MWRCVALMLSLVLLAGCQSARVAEPLTHQIEGEGADSAMAFWHTLPERKLVSNDAAFHGLLLYFEQEAPADYAGRVRLLKERNWLPADFDQPAELAVTRGTLAVILAQALDIEGGLMMRMFGHSPRYATRELSYLSIYPYCTPQQTVDGVGLVELVSKVEDYQRRYQSLELRQPTVPVEEAAPQAEGQRPNATLVIGASRAAHRSKALARILATLLASPTVVAQAEEAPMPPAAPADPNALPIVITSVNGMVQMRPAEGQPWGAVKVGQKLTIGAEFRTGPRSMVQFTVGDTQTVTLDRLGTVKVVDAIKADGKVQTDVGMKYGRTTLQVQAAGVEHESKIRTPSATLSVRGSVGAVEDIGSTLRAAGYEGDVAWTRGAGQYISLPPGSEHEKDQTSTGQNQVADSGLNLTYLSPLEQYLVSVYGGDFFQQEEGNFESFRDQDVFDDQHNEASNEEDFTSNELNFVVGWLGFSDIDGFVVSPFEESLSAKNNPSVSSGGETSPDQTGRDGESVEVLYWADNAPTGTYIYGAEGYDVVEPTTVTITVYYRGQLVSSTSGTISQTGETIDSSVTISGTEQPPPPLEFQSPQ